MEDNICGFTESIISWLKTSGIDIAVNVLAAIAILVFGAIGIKIIKKILKVSFKPFMERNELAANFALSFLIKCCWLFLVVIVLGKLGVDIAPLIAGLGATGVVAGFAFKESLASLAAGLMIAINQPFKVGDHAIIAGNEGKVIKLDMMAVTIETTDGRTITIPNQVAWGGAITVKH